MVATMMRTAWCENHYQANRQSGIALIVVLVLLGLLVGVLAVGFTGDLIRQNKRDQQTADALAQAKEALIGYAANYRDRNSPPSRVFGYLPCPDDLAALGTEGAEDPSCGTKDVTVIGRLPWKSLGVSALRDGQGECLWYAVSGNFKANPPTDLLNWDTNGLLEVMTPDGTTFFAGATASNRAAAVIFAPGAIIQGQDRTPVANAPTCQGNYTAANYLDTDLPSGIDNASANPTANALTRFIAALNSDNTTVMNARFNDKLLFITPTEIFSRAQKRSDFLSYLTDSTTGLLRLSADCIARYSTTNSPANNQALPWAAPVALSNYSLANFYHDASGTLAGRLPYDIDNTVAVVPNSLPGPGNVLLTSCQNWTTVDEFWRNWKDHLFYVIADAHKPGSPLATTPVPCDAPGAKCLSVDGAGPFAAVLIFANERGGQSRNNDPNPAYTSNADKSNPTNYLEGTNLAALQAGSDTADTNWGKFSKTAGNDILICIRKDLTVDSTCAAASSCTSDAAALLAYRSGATNNCKTGPKTVLQACKDLKDRIKSNNCSCKKDADKFINKPCIDNLNDPTCAPIITNLSSCS